MKLERRTGESRNDVGLRPGGIVMQGDLEIGSFAGDMSLYFALIDDPPEVVAQPSITTPAEDCGSPVAGAPSITAFHSQIGRAHV